MAVIIAPVIILVINNLKGSFIEFITRFWPIRWHFQDTVRIFTHGLNHIGPISFFIRHSHQYFNALYFSKRLTSLCGKMTFLLTYTASEQQIVKIVATKFGASQRHPSTLYCVITISFL